MADPHPPSSSISQFHVNTPSMASSTDYSSLAKTLNSNMPMKLDTTNYIFVKTKVIPAIRALELEHYISSSYVIP
ncbi:hypothetical protein ACOSQ4_004331 [Xanthoceras sorbifolium]